MKSILLSALLILPSFAFAQGQQFEHTPEQLLILTEQENNLSHYDQALVRCGALLGIIAHLFEEDDVDVFNSYMDRAATLVNAGQQVRLDMAPEQTGFQRDPEELLNDILLDVGEYSRIYQDIMSEKLLTTGSYLSDDYIENELTQCVLISETESSE